MTNRQAHPITKLFIGIRSFHQFIGLVLACPEGGTARVPNR
jgi:hypothetical protein